MSTTAAVSINFNGNMEDVRSAARVFLGETALASTSNDDLLTELRQRFAAQTPPMVVRVLAFADEAGPTDAPKTTRKPRAEKATEAKTTEMPPDQSVPAREEPKATVQGTQEPAAADASEWGGEEATAAVKTIDDVRASLNACAAKIGQAGTREIMVATGGAARLVDVKAENFGKLVDALNSAEPAKAAA